MIGSIQKLFAAIFGVFVTILKLPLTLVTLPLKLLSSGKKDQGDAKAPKKIKQGNEAFFLDEKDAKGFSAEPKAATPVKTAPAPTATAALNLPKPTVTGTSTSAPTSSYTQFGSRRRPGANMKSFLDMAKNLKST